jgi:thiol-disulfide isomerase/thioredoxin
MVQAGLRVWVDMVGVVSLVVVLAGATAFGLLWQRRSGLVRAVGTPAGNPALAGLGVDPAAAPVTLVQFSSAFCAPCRATRRILAEVVTMLPAVRHVDVDAEQHLDAVRALGILRTPTVLVIDGAGQIVRRASGTPRKADVIAAVAPYLP